MPEDPASSERLARATVYFVALVYMFLGVSIIADRFMASIEVITSQERKITIKKPGGEKISTRVRVWNETVSNLTLMALGSSAPEILLSVVEVCGHNFNAGELGPNTIVGSAAFNMFVIIGLCVSVVPEGQTRKVKHLRVFFVTAAWSIFAYTWLYLILAVSTPGVVEIWEGLLTLLFFPVCVGLAYVADRRLLFYKYVYKRYRVGKRKGVIVEMEGEPEGEEPGGGPRRLQEEAPKGLGTPKEQKWTLETGTGPVPKKSTRAAAADLCSDGPGTFSSRLVFPPEDGTARASSERQPTQGSLEKISTAIVVNHALQADKPFLVHLGNVSVVCEGGRAQEHLFSSAASALPATAGVTNRAGVFTFEEETVIVSKNIGVMEVKVLRTSGARGAVAVPYATTQGTARGGGENFEDTRGVLEFDDNEICKSLHIRIVDDGEFGQDKNFLLELGEPRLLDPSQSQVLLVYWFHSDVTGCHLTLVTCPDRDVYRKLQGWNLPDAVINITEDRGETLPTNRDKEEQQGAVLGEPALGDHVKLEVTIKESYEFKNTVDKLLKKTNLALVVGTNSWREQFVDAITVSSGKFSGGDDEEKLPSGLDYVMHFLTVFWKLLFALVPPTEYWSGWACFMVSISIIGVLTAIIGDIASHFGCTVGLKDSVTAVVFVALGTSVPDTFASKVSAVQDQYADASIGNVTGSNAVNVFLGIGVAWSIAAIYHYSQGEEFKVDPGTLAFSVTLFTIFAFVCIAVLVYRRRPEIGGELGGPKVPKMLTTGLFFSLWLMYIFFSSLEAYCHIQAF
ncbi:unnamed protein product, partial [Tetraodon nigroviridis]